MLALDMKLAEILVRADFGLPQDAALPLPDNWEQCVGPRWSKELLDDANRRKIDHVRNMLPQPLEFIKPLTSQKHSVIYVPPKPKKPWWKVWLKKDKKVKSKLGNPEIFSKLV